MTELCTLVTTGSGRSDTGDIVAWKYGHHCPKLVSTRHEVCDSERATCAMDWENAITTGFAPGPIFCQWKLPCRPASRGRTLYSGDDGSEPS